MKIGVISDIHGNIEALQATLKEFDKINVEKIICCGDVIGIGVNPEEAVQELIKRQKNLIAVRGNHERYLLDGLPETIHDDKRAMIPDEIEHHKWIQSRLSKESKKFLSTFPISKSIEIEDRKIYIIHYPMNGTSFKKHIKKPTIEENEEMFKEIDADIFLYGHTHEFSINTRNNKWYINPGSLGCPVGTNIVNAGILDISENKVNFRPLNVKYDVEKVIEKIRQIQLPLYKENLKTFYG